jgi:hypothetical protein
MTITANIGHGATFPNNQATAAMHKPTMVIMNVIANKKSTIFAIRLYAQSMFDISLLIPLVESLGKVLSFLNANLSSFKISCLLNDFILTPKFSRPIWLILTHCRFWILFRSGGYAPFR